MTGPRKLLAAAVLFTAACSTGRAPAPRTASHSPPVTEAVAETTPAPVTVTPAVMPAATPAVEVIAVTAPAAEEAAAPRCDENGRPLAGNVRTKGPMQTCEAK